ncbi:hypothetical protein PVAP13_8KG370602 [Panicum virgatum]|uniref:Uncharacterized protein n=1 Tax=Panicum virgatum TaxID=38727 RepID=A0A8T0PTQ1_PANVG|nr:hypothetical protein PVAP13_8KG370602 [Panicum virgatum]
MLLVGAGEVRCEPCTELFPGLDRPRCEVHEPGPGWPRQGYMKVACHDGAVATSCCDGGNVHLQEFRRVSSTVVLFRQVGAELGWPCHGAEVLRKRSTAHPGHRCPWLNPGVHRRPGCRRVQIDIEVASLNVETALSRPLDSDAGILPRAPAVELRPQVFCSCTPHGGGAHRCRRTALTLVVRYHRVARRRSLPSLCRTGGGLSQVEETVDVVSPLPQGVWRGCLSRRVAKQLPSRG